MTKTHRASGRIAVGQAAQVVDKKQQRRPRLDVNSFVDKSWTDYYNEETDYVSPHYQAYLWAAFLWMYALTGIEELLTKSEKAIAMVMERFPDQLRWQNSLTGEISRMLLPLSFLVRVHPTEQNRRWLKQAVDAMLEYQQPCGAYGRFGRITAAVRAVRF